MTDDPFKEASKYNTAVRNVERWQRKRVDAITEEAARKYYELKKALSPAAARIVVAAEGSETTASTARLEAIENAADSGYDDSSPDPNPAPDWMNAEPPPLPPGHMIEVPEKQGKRARG